MARYGGETTAVVDEVDEQGRSLTTARSMTTRRRSEGTGQVDERLGDSEVGTEACKSEGVSEWNGLICSSQWQYLSRNGTMSPPSQQCATSLQRTR